MSFDPHAGLPHEPAPREPRRILPEPDSLIRGAALVGVAVTAAWLARSSFRATWLLTPVAAVLAAASILAGWAAAVHLTGGEKFDDHPFV